MDRADDEHVERLRPVPFHVEVRTALFAAACRSGSTHYGAGGVKPRYRYFSACCIDGIVQECWVAVLPAAGMPYVLPT